MSADVERRLRDLFTTIDEQVVAPPPTVVPLRRPPRRVGRYLLAAAAVVAVVALAAGLLAGRGRDDATDVAAGPPVTIAASEFDGRANEVCLALDRRRNGVRPRFPTAEAYLVVAEARVEAIDEAVAALAAVPGPDDEPALPTRVLTDLRSARELATSVAGLAAEGRADEAAALWAELDPTIDGALGALGDHGAERCRFDRGG